MSNFPNLCQQLIFELVCSRTMAQPEEVNKRLSTRFRLQALAEVRQPCGFSIAPPLFVEIKAHGIAGPTPSELVIESQELHAMWADLTKPIWLWIKTRCPKWNPGKWKHGPKPAVPWLFGFDPYPRCPVRTESKYVLDKLLASPSHAPNGQGLQCERSLAT